MLPYFFRHYDRLIDHYFIHDNQSTDGSLRILNAHPRVTVLPLVLEGDSRIDAAFAQVNQFWHPSRGVADWVAVCNVDELFWHADLRWYLDECRKKGITYLQSIGYQMVTDRFPAARDNLARKHRLGVRSIPYDKPAFFNPNKITESGFLKGRHRARPRGHVVRAETDEILLLHYKHLGIDYLRERHAELNARRMEIDIARGLGRHYGEAKTIESHQKFREMRQEVIQRPSIVSRLRRRWWGDEVKAQRPSEKLEVGG